MGSNRERRSSIIPGTGARDADTVISGAISVKKTNCLRNFTICDPEENPEEDVSFNNDKNKKRQFVKEKTDKFLKNNSSIGLFSEQNASGQDHETENSWAENAENSEKLEPNQIVLNSRPPLILNKILGRVKLPICSQANIATTSEFEILGFNNGQHAAKKIYLKIQIEHRIRGKPLMIFAHVCIHEIEKFQRGAAGKYELLWAKLDETRDSKFFEQV